MKIAFYGSSLLSSYWNGAATYYRGLLARARQARLGHHLLRTRRLRPAAASRHRAAGLCARRGLDRRRRRRAARHRRGRRRPTWWSRRAASACSTTSCWTACMAAAGPDALRIFWDVDAAATLAEMRADGPDHPLRRALPELDLVLTYGGGPPVVQAYERWARARAGRSTTRSTRDPSSRRRRSALRRRPQLPRQPAAGSRGARRALLPRARCRGAGPPLPARRHGLGRQADAGRTSRASATSAPPTTTPSTLRALAVLNVARDSMATSASRPPPACSRRPAPAPA